MCLCHCVGIATGPAQNLIVAGLIKLISNKAGGNMSIIARPKEDFTDMRFGRLVVKYRADDYVFPNGKGKAARWHCECDCGNEVDVRHDKLKNGTTTSCGCYKKN